MTTSITDVFERQNIVDYSDDEPARKVQFTFSAGELKDLRMAFHAAEHYFVDSTEPGHEKWTDAAIALRKVFFDAETWANGGAV